MNKHKAFGWGVFYASVFLQIVFLALKLSGYAMMNWWVVFSPSLVYLGFVFLVVEFAGWAAIIWYVNSEDK